MAARLREAGLPCSYEGAFVFEKSDRGEGPVFGYSSQVVELDVNTETGQVRVTRLVNVADVGKPINPRTFAATVEQFIRHPLSSTHVQRAD